MPQVSPNFGRSFIGTTQERWSTHAQPRTVAAPSVAIRRMGTTGASTTDFQKRVPGGFSVRPVNREQKFTASKEKPLSYSQQSFYCCDFGFTVTLRAT